MDAVDDYIRTQSVEPYFPDFHDFIYEHQILFGVVTQRMGRIVETILRRQGLERIPVFANQIDVEPFTIRLRFPYFNVMSCQDCPSCNLYPPEALPPAGRAADLRRREGAGRLRRLGRRPRLRARRAAQALRGDGAAPSAIHNLRDVERILSGMILTGELERLPRKEGVEVRPLDAGQVTAKTREDLIVDRAGRLGQQLRAHPFRRPDDADQRDRLVAAPAPRRCASDR